MLCMRGRRKSMYRYFSLVSSLILSASCSSGRMGGASALLKISISSATNSTSPLASLGFAPPVRMRTVPRTPITSSRRNPRALSIRAAALDSIPKTTWARPSLSRRSTKKSPFPCSRYVLIQPQSVTVCPAWDGRSSPQYCVRFSMLNFHFLRVGDGSETANHCAVRLCPWQELRRSFSSLRSNPLGMRTQLPSFANFVD